MKPAGCLAVWAPRPASHRQPLLRAYRHPRRPADYSGPQWPFLYTYGSLAAKRNVTRLINVLSET